MGLFSAAKDNKENCPMNKETLGTSTWNLLHTMGVVYPENPTPEYKKKTENFIRTLSLLYPCPPCAEDFQTEIEKNPPRLDSRSTFSIWLCEQHNAVNAKLDKPVFECTMEKLDERWKKGRDACYED